MCFSMPVLRSARAAEHGADDRRAEDLGGVDHPRELLFRRSLRLVEHRRGRTDRPHADLEVEPELVGARAHLPQVVGLEAAEEPDLAEVDDFDLPLRGEIHLLERRPVLGAEAEHVDAEPDRRSRLGSCGLCAVAVAGACAPSASVAAPRVFTNVRRSAGMASFVDMASVTSVRPPLIRAA